MYNIHVFVIMIALTVLLMDRNVLIFTFCKSNVLVVLAIEFQLFYHRFIGLSLYHKKSWKTSLTTICNSHGTTNQRILSNKAYLVGFFLCIYVHCSVHVHFKVFTFIDYFCFFNNSFQYKHVKLFVESYFFFKCTCLGLIEINLNSFKN